MKSKQLWRPCRTASGQRGTTPKSRDIPTRKPPRFWASRTGPSCREYPVGGNGSVSLWPTSRDWRQRNGIGIQECIDHRRNGGHWSGMRAAHGTRRRVGHHHRPRRRAREGGGRRGRREGALRLGRSVRHRGGGKAFGAGGGRRKTG